MGLTSIGNKYSKIEKIFRKKENEYKSIKSFNKIDFSQVNPDFSKLRGMRRVLSHPHTLRGPACPPLTAPQAAWELSLICFFLPRHFSLIVRAEIRATRFTWIRAVISALPEGFSGQRSFIAPDSGPRIQSKIIRFSLTFGKIFCILIFWKSLLPICVEKLRFSSSSI